MRSDIALGHSPKILIVAGMRFVQPGTWALNAFYIRGIVTAVLIFPLRLPRARDRDIDSYTIARNIRREPLPRIQMVWTYFPDEKDM